jgi:hypothetical protein
VGQCKGAGAAKSMPGQEGNCWEWKVEDCVHKLTED